MPRRRMIDPGIWNDPEVGELTAEQFKLFIGCISLADDEGRLDGDPRTLRKAIFGYSQNVTVDDVRLWRNSLAQKLPNVELYAIDGRDYIALLQWHKHQAISTSWRKPSMIPEPPKDMPSTCEAHAEQVPSTFDACAEQPQGTCPLIKLIESSELTESMESTLAPNGAKREEADMPTPDEMKSRIAQAITSHEERQTGPKA